MVLQKTMLLELRLGSMRIKNSLNKGGLPSLPIIDGGNLKGTDEKELLIPKDKKLV